MTGPGPLAAAGISSTTPHFIWARLSYYFTGGLSADCISCLAAASHGPSGLGK